MKVYLAARFGRREQLKALRSKIEAMGCWVVASWLDTKWQDPGDGGMPAPPEYRAEWAVKDMEDVRRADIVVSFTEGDGSGRRGGRHVEYGMAAAWGKHLIVVGPRENIFYHLPQAIVVEEEAQLLYQLSQLLIASKAIQEGKR